MRDCYDATLLLNMTSVITNPFKNATILGRLENSGSEKPNKRFPKISKLTLQWLPANSNSIFLVQPFLRGDVTETVSCQSFQLFSHDTLSSQHLAE